MLFQVSVSRSSCGNHPWVMGFVESNVERLTAVFFSSSPAKTRIHGYHYGLDDCWIRSACSCRPYFSIRCISICIVQVVEWAGADKNDERWRGSHQTNPPRSSPHLDMANHGRATIPNDSTKNTHTRRRRPCRCGLNRQHQRQTYCRTPLSDSLVIYTLHPTHAVFADALLDIFLFF